MTRFNTRKADVNDVEAMVRLQRLGIEKAWRPILGDKFDAFAAERLEEQSQIKKYRERVEDPERLLLVAEDSRHIIGFGGIRVQRPDEEPKGFPYQMNALYVDPFCEGQGAGKLLMERFQEELLRKKISGFCLWCLADNTHARNFYEKRGGKLITDAVTPKEYSDVSQHVAYGWTLARLN